MPDALRISAMARWSVRSLGSGSGIGCSALFWKVIFKACGKKKLFDVDHPLKVLIL
jgi:hypothetical protein